MTNSEVSDVNTFADLIWIYVWLIVPLNVIAFAVGIIIGLVGPR
jgi:flagellar biosynthesis protein FliQ